MKLNRSIKVLMILVAISATESISAEKTPLRKIAFCGEHEGGLHILVPDSGEIKEINIGMPNIRDLAYTNVKQLLAFEGSSDHDHLPSLYILDLKNNKKSIIYDANSNKHHLYRPAFEPKGEYLYAVNYSDGIYQYSFSVDNWKKVSLLGVKGLNPQGLAFSNSGQKVAISPGNFKGFLIATVDKVTDFVVEKHILKKFDSCINPQWIGDSVIIFAGRKKPGLQFIWKFDLDSGKLSQLTAPPIGARDYLSLSKDEKTIVFTATGEKLEWRLWQVFVDGTGIRQLTKGGKLSSHLSPVWLD